MEQQSHEGNGDQTELLFVCFSAERMRSIKWRQCMSL